MIEGFFFHDYWSFLGKAILAFFIFNIIIIIIIFFFLGGGGSRSGGHGGLEVSALDSESRGTVGHCVLFLGKTLYSHSASFHPGVEMGTGELSGKPDEILGGGGVPATA